MPLKCDLRRFRRAMVDYTKKGIEALYGLAMGFRSDHSAHFLFQPGKKLNFGTIGAQCQNAQKRYAQFVQYFA